jgi:methyl-accepting chemotaxis protein
MERVDTGMFNKTNASRSFKFGLTAKFILPTSITLILSLGISCAVTYYEMSGTMTKQMSEITSDNIKTIENTLKNNESAYSLAKNQLYNDLAVKAKAVAQVIASNPGAVSNDMLKSLAKTMVVDNIVVSDEMGLSRFSSVNTFIGYNFDSSDNSKLFMKALIDKNFVMVQEPVLNGVNKKLFQYAAVARQDASGIIQVGVEPKTLSVLLENISI